MRIAIVGSGFAGLALCTALIDQKSRVDVFDHMGFSGGASGISAGLLHTYAGKHAKKNWHGDAAFDEAVNLLQTSSTALNQKTFQHSGMLRLAMSPQQEEDFHFCASSYEDVHWMDADKCTKSYPYLPEKPGIFIKTALTVYPQLHLEGMKRYCERLGACFLFDKVQTLEQLSSYDKIIICSGANAKDLVPIKTRSIKGQILQLSWPKEIPPLPFPVNSRVYIAMATDNTSCFVGATFERTFIHEETDLEAAKEELLPMAFEILPFLKDSKILGCKAGIRCSTPDHKPIIEQVDSRTWVYTGLGSKGLLYHAYFANQLASRLV